MKKIANFWYVLNFLFWTCTPFLLLAQNPSGTGLLMEDRAYKATTLIDEKDGSKYLLPDTSSLKRYCPTPGDQGPIGSCVAWATGYHAMTITKAIQEGISNEEVIQSLAHSASYIFNQIKIGQDCQIGAYLTEALKFLQESGTPPSTLFKNSLSDCTACPGAKATQEALKNRIDSFPRIFDLGEKDSIKIENTKLWLSRQKPVIIGIRLTDNYDDIAWNQKKWSPNYSSRKKSNPTRERYHAMVVVGYKNRGTSGEFELLNSQGPYWGNNGFINLNYEDYGKLVQYAFIIGSVGHFPNNPIVKLPQPPKGSLRLGESTDTLTKAGLRRINIYRDGSHDFTTPSVYFDKADNCYKPSDSSWDQESQYQIIAKTPSTENYLYVFSFDAQEKVIPIWPPKDPVDRLRSLQYTEITIPSEMEALAFSHPGKDYVALLYSSQELTDFDKYLTAFEELSGSFQERMQAVFGDLLIDENLVEYTPDALNFKCDLKENVSSVVPLIIAFDVK